MSCLISWLLSFLLCFQVYASKYLNMVWYFNVGDSKVVVVFRVFFLAGPKCSINEG